MRFLTERGEGIGTVGLALSSGGAKGMAHIGAIEALEEAGIFVDCYAGTSIGSIVGALCACGMRSREIRDIVGGVCLREYLRYVRPYMDMSFIEKMLDEYLGKATFRTLKKPFFAWATDVGTRTGVLIEKGNVAKACTASSAVPPYFHSVALGGRELIDGAYTNPMPADVLKEKGARFVIGIDLNARVGKGVQVHYYNRLTKWISLTLDSAVANGIGVEKGIRKRGYAACDIVIKPDLTAFSTLDAMPDPLDKMYEAGYLAARALLPKLQEKLKEIKK